MFIAILLTVLFGVSCAQVQVKAPKEPIKVDISMRVDVYQHIQKDINAIEDIVTGDGAPGAQTSFLDILVPSAYAAEGLSAEVENAALRRKARYADIVSLEKQGIVGDTRAGFLAVRKPDMADKAVKSVVEEENKDRAKIYEALAEKNGVTIAEIEKVYAVRLQNDAPAGTPIEIPDERTGAYGWKQK